MNNRSDAIQLTTAVLALGIGVLVYLLDRQPSDVYFIPDWVSIADSLNPIFGQVGNNLPTFIHVYVFILLTVIIITPSPVMVFRICVIWFSVDSLFELAQLTPIAYLIAEHIPAWFIGIPFLENTATYFLAGTFDILDIISIAMGTVTAYLTIRYSNKRGIQHVPET